MYESLPITLRIPSPMKPRTDISCSSGSELLQEVRRNPCGIVLSPRSFECSHGKIRPQRGIGAEKDQGIMERLLIWLVDHEPATMFAAVSGYCGVGWHMCQDWHTTRHIFSDLARERRFREVAHCRVKGNRNKRDVRLREHLGNVL